MSTYTQILYQIVFGSKSCTDFINPNNREFLFCYMAGISKNKKCMPYIVGGHGNHIHMIISIHQTQNLSSLIKQLKNASNNMMKENKGRFFSFPGWQVGYGAFTYHYSSKHRLIRYVENQEEHHRIQTFEKELINLCKEHRVAYDTKYLLI